jgi:hypothetical protein
MIIRIGFEVVGILGIGILLGMWLKSILDDRLIQTIKKDEDWPDGNQIHRG